MTAREVKFSDAMSSMQPRMPLPRLVACKLTSMNNTACEGTHLKVRKGVKIRNARLVCAATTSNPTSPQFVRFHRIP